MLTVPVMTMTTAALVFVPQAGVDWQATQQIIDTGTVVWIMVDGKHDGGWRVRYGPYHGFLAKENLSKVRQVLENQDTADDLREGSVLLFALPWTGCCASVLVAGTVPGQD
jgi:hypothetical protein